MKIYKKMLCFFLITLGLCLNGGGVLFASSGYTLPKTLKLTDNNENNMSIRVEQGYLYINHMPEHESFNYVIVRVLNSNTKVLVQQEKYARIMGSQEDVKHDMTTIASGTYDMQLYLSSEENGRFISYIYNGLQVKTAKNSIAILKPLVYDENKKALDNNRKDVVALDYYLQPTAQIQSKDNYILSLVDEICGGAETEYEKAGRIHDWIAKNIWYDYDIFTGKSKIGDMSATTVLKEKKAVCNGYANLTAAMMRAAGLPTKVVNGYALGMGEPIKWTKAFIKKDKPNHTWNEVFVDGRWIILDTTWDSSNKYENGRFSTEEWFQDRKYFDPTILFFSTTHRLLKNQKDGVPALEKAKAFPNQVTIVVNDNAYELTAYNIRNNYYVKLRDLAKILSPTEKPFNVKWDQQKNSIIIEIGKNYSSDGKELSLESQMQPLEAIEIGSKVQIDGTNKKFKAYTIGNNSYFQLREVMKYMDIFINFDGEMNQIHLDTKRSYQ